METRSDNPASAMKVPATGAMFGRSMWSHVGRDPQTVADPDIPPEPPTYIQPDVDRLCEPWHLSEADFVAP